MSGRPWNSSAQLGVLFAVVVTAFCRPAFATQLISTGDCAFVMHVPGLFGGKDLHLTMRKGALFTEGGNGKFCGRVAQATPFGDSSGDQCFVIAHGKLISGRWSDKVTASTCHLTNAAAMRTHFDASAMAPWSGGGPATLHGQAFLKTVGGDVKTCAGARVLLLPASPYVDEVLAKKSAGITVNQDPRLQSYTRSTICDAQGNFSFANLPVQKWYVITRVTWGVPQADGPGDEPETSEQGGKLMKAVSLAPGDNQVFLTYRDEQ